MRRRFALVILVLASGCIQTFQGVKVTPVDLHNPVVVTTPVKAHLLDGSTVIYRDGATVDQRTVQGQGYRYDLTLRDSTLVSAISLDSIVGMEAFEQTTNTGASLVMTLLATAGGLALVAGAAVAIFGSCPTFYTDSAGSAQLQAEGFSYSIAPIFESRDIDRLRITQAADGTLRLEVRNEALETHYINQLELLEAGHDADETALVDELNRIVVLGPTIPFRHAIDMRGTDVTDVLSQHDGAVYRTDARTMRHAEIGDLDDWITLTVPAPAADSVAIVLRLRNSLLNTTLLYDVMLGEPGARSLDWVGQDLKQVGPALDVAQWYQQRMGMNVAVSDGFTYRVIAHVRDTTAATDTSALASLRNADNRYLQTTPGQYFTAVFRASDTRPASADQHTFFLASQGNYIDLGTLIGDWKPDRDTMERLRLLSRFPAGLTPELRGRLLAAYGQTEV